VIHHTEFSSRQPSQHRKGGRTKKKKKKKKRKKEKKRERKRGIITMREAYIHGYTLVHP
jgi:DNA invertase Pin-like site-specific DNA recombinase